MGGSAEKRRLLATRFSARKWALFFTLIDVSLLLLTKSWPKLGSRLQSSDVIELAVKSRLSNAVSPRKLTSVRLFRLRLTTISSLFLERSSLVSLLSDIDKYSRLGYFERSISEMLLRLRSSCLRAVLGAKSNLERPTLSNVMARVSANLLISTEDILALVILNTVSFSSGFDTKTRTFTPLLVRAVKRV